jgi:hypothetical protein
MLRRTGKEIESVPGKIEIDLSDVQKTLLLPLWGRAVETRKKNPMLVDTAAVGIIKRYTILERKNCHFGSLPDVQTYEEGDVLQGKMRNLLVRSVAHYVHDSCEVFRINEKQNPRYNIHLRRHAAFGIEIP